MTQVKGGKPKGGKKKSKYWWNGMVQENDVREGIKPRPLQQKEETRGKTRRNSGCKTIKLYKSDMREKGHGHHGSLAELASSDDVCVYVWGGRRCCILWSIKVWRAVHL